MSVEWTIDLDKRFMRATATGDVQRDEVDRFLDAIEAHSALGFRKLFDCLQATTSMPPDEMMALGVRMRAMHFQGPMGPLAIVVPPGRLDYVEQMFGMIAAADRPMRLFKELAPAETWIEAQKSRRRRRSSSKPG